MALSLGLGASFSSANSIGEPGFSAKMELPIVSRLNFMFSAGYFVNYFGTRIYLDTSPAICPTCSFPTENPINQGPYEFIPLKAGLRYYYFRHFYIDGVFGEAIKANVTDNSFVYGGEIGGLIPFNRHNSLDINIGIENGYKFEYYQPAVYELAIRIAYGYQF